jgi:uncharacterized protein
MRLVIFGATGYAGSRIMREALDRGHQVVAVARNVDSLEGQVEGRTVRSGSLHDRSFVHDVTAGAAVVVISIPGRPAEDGSRLLDAVPTFFAAARESGARLGVVGGAGSLQVSEGGPRLLDTPAFPEAARTESESHAQVLDAFRAAPADVDWFYVSPPAMFGAHSPGERRGTYRVGGEVLLTDADGTSMIGGDDFALAFVDEIEKPAHHRARFTVAY